MIFKYTSVTGARNFNLNIIGAPAEDSMKHEATDNKKITDEIEIFLNCCRMRK